MKNIYLLALLLLCVITAYGQKSTYDALNAFLNTQLFQEFEKIRTRAENAVLDFKSIESSYSEEDISRVRDAYNLSVDRFNRVLENIKTDMLDRNIRKYIASYPSGYSKQIEADFYRAKDYYVNTFQREVISLTDGQVTGSALIALLPQIIGYIDQAVQVYKQIQSELNKINEQMLNTYLIEKYRFRTWDEIY